MIIVLVLPQLPSYTLSLRLAVCYIGRGLPNSRRRLADFVGRLWGRLPYSWADHGAPPHASDWLQGLSIIWPQPSSLIGCLFTATMSLPCSWVLGPLWVCLHPSLGSVVPSQDPDPHTPGSAPLWALSLLPGL